MQSYRAVATESGPVFVWAAGNGSDNEVSVRSGLPYHFPELEENWLAVVSVDQFGQEPSYTNRCGVSAAWCITAPGGGDDEDLYGIIGAQAGGGYTFKSGTSMAAPLVSGALSLIMEAMPTISPRDAAERLKQTARYDGLTTANGCTIDTCPEDEIRNVFGHGLINVSAALQPIGSASVLEKGGGKHHLKQTYINVPPAMGSAFEHSLNGAIAVVHDSFDGALMLTDLRGALLTPQDKGNSEMRMAIDAGAVGYIPKNIGIKAFYSAMTLMAEGEVFLPADHGGHKSENRFIPENWLTGREQDMLAGLLDGKSNKEIARKHGLSEVTVKHHLKSLRGKLGAKNRTHAVCRAIELGIVPE